MRRKSLADTPAGQMTTALLLLSAILLPLGLLLPALQTREVFWRDEHTILGFGLSLYEDGEFLLAGLLFGFSVVFPVAKLVWMTRLQFGRIATVRPWRLSVLEMLGKWSLADVLVIALIVLSLRESLVFGARPLPGVFIFAAATVLAMLASGRIVRQLRYDASPPSSPSDGVIASARASRR